MGITVIFFPKSLKYENLFLGNNLKIPRVSLFEKVYGQYIHSSVIWTMSRCEEVNCLDGADSVLYVLFSAGSDPFPLPASYLSKKRDERNMEEIWNEKRIVYDTKQKGLRRPKDLSAISKSPRRSFSNSWPDGSFGEDAQPRRSKSGFI